MPSSSRDRGRMVDGETDGTVGGRGWRGWNWVGCGPRRSASVLPAERVAHRCLEGGERRRRVVAAGPALVARDRRRGGLALAARQEAQEVRAEQVQAPGRRSCRPRRRLGAGGDLERIGGERREVEVEAEAPDPGVRL